MQKDFVSSVVSATGHNLDRGYGHNLPVIAQVDEDCRLGFNTVTQIKPMARCTEKLVFIYSGTP
jgi:hypothetical protein